MPEKLLVWQKGNAAKKELLSNPEKEIMVYYYNPVIGVRSNAKRKFNDIIHLEQNKVTWWDIKSEVI